MLTLVRQRAPQSTALSPHYSSFAYSLLLILVTLKQCIVIIMVNKNSSGLLFWQYLSSLYFLGKHLFYLFFVLKNSAVQYRSNVKWCCLIWATLTLKLTHILRN